MIMKYRLHFESSAFNYLYVSAIVTFFVGQILRYFLVMDDSQIMTGIDNVTFLHESRKSYFEEVKEGLVLQYDTCVEIQNFQETNKMVDKMENATILSNNTVNLNLTKTHQNLTENVILSHSTTNYTPTCTKPELHSYTPEFGTNWGRVLLVFSLVLWLFGILHFLQAFKQLEPYVTMMGKMLLSNHKCRVSPVESALRALKIVINPVTFCPSLSRRVPVV